MQAATKNKKLKFTIRTKSVLKKLILRQAAIHIYLCKRQNTKNTSKISGPGVPTKLEACAYIHIIVQKTNLCKHLI